MSAKMDGWNPYRNTGFGRPTGPRGKRPKEDSLPSNRCEAPGCGTARASSTLGLKLSARNADPAWLDTPLWFCSWGCVSRFAIVQEIRQ